MEYFGGRKQANMPEVIDMDVSITDSEDKGSLSPIEVTLDVDANGIVSVRAQDIDHGGGQEISEEELIGSLPPEK